MRVFNRRKTDLKYNQLKDIEPDKKTGRVWKYQKIKPDPIEYIPEEEDENE